MMMLDPEILSRKFSAILNEWLEEDELQQIQKLNAAEISPDVCHSHDFCDPNQAMIDALQDLGHALDLQDSEQIQAINRAWTISKANNFKV